jgi:hypothetical protein
LTLILGTQQMVARRGEIVHWIQHPGVNPPMAEAAANGIRPSVSHRTMF